MTDKAVSKIVGEYASGLDATLRATSVYLSRVLHEKNPSSRAQSMIIALQSQMQSMRNSITWTIKTLAQETRNDHE